MKKGRSREKKGKSVSTALSTGGVVKTELMSPEGIALIEELKKKQKEVDRLTAMVVVLGKFNYPALAPKTEKTVFSLGFAGGVAVMLLVGLFLFSHFTQQPAMPQFVIRTQTVQSADMTAKQQKLMEKIDKLLKQEKLFSAEKMAWEAEKRAKMTALERLSFTAQLPAPAVSAPAPVRAPASIMLGKTVHIVNPIKHQLLIYEWRKLREGERRVEGEKGKLNCIVPPEYVKPISYEGHDGIVLQAVGDRFETSVSEPSDGDFSKGTWVWVFDEKGGSFKTQDLRFLPRR